MVSISVFEAERSQLTAIAFRLLGSIHDAEDAVQTTWLKASAIADHDLRNPPAYVTVVLTRECFEQLRTRKRRREESLIVDMLHGEEMAADERYLQRENVSRALMVVLDQLTPPQRVAYVLHDLFELPFREVAQILDVSADTAKKHASRARRRISQREAVPSTAATEHAAIVAAFLWAASNGDTTRMVELMSEDCARVVDPSLVPPRTQTTVVGAAAVVSETALFVERIRASVPILADGRPVHVIAPGGHGFGLIDMTVKYGRITRVEIQPVTPKTRLSMASILP